MLRKIISILLCMFMVGASVIPQNTKKVYALDNSMFEESELVDDTIDYPTTTDTDFDISGIDLSTEVISERTADTKTFRRVDGTYILAVYDSNVHYNDNGEWIEIDNSLTPDSETDSVMNKSNIFKIKLPNNIDDNKKFKLFLENYEIDWSVDSIEKTNISYEVTESTAKSMKDLDGMNQSVVYESIQTNVNLEYILNGTTLKENILLDKYIENFSISFTYNLKNLSLVEDSDGNYVFVNESNDAVMSFDSLYMIDNNGDISEDVQISVIEQKKDEYQIVVTPNDDFLDNASYPVTIDPSITFNNGTSMIEDKYVYSNYSTSNNYLKAGYIDTYSYYYRSYMKFDLTNFSSDIIINYAHLSLSTYNNLCTSDITIVANEVFASQPYDGNDGINEQLMEIVENRPLDYFNVPLSDGNSGTYKLDLTHAFNKWVSEGNTARIIELRRLDETDSGWIAFYSNDYEEAVSPALEIGYVKTAGIKDYWTYNSQDVGVAGTGYISDYTGTLTFMRTDILFETDKQSLGVSFAYNNIFKSTNVGYGDGWNIYYNKEVKHDSECSQYYMLEADGNRVYFNYTSVEYPYSGVRVYRYISEDGRGLELIRSFYNSTLMSITIEDPSENKYTFSITDGLLISVSNQSSIGITIGRDSSIPEKVNFIKDSSDNYLRFNYDIDNRLASILLRTEAIDIDPNGSSTDYLKKIVYEYKDNTNKLEAVKYYSDTNLDNDIVIDQTVNYLYDDNERLKEGSVDSGEKVIYYYEDASSYRIEMVESYYNSEKISKTLYEFKFMQTIITDHTDNFVIYKFDQYGHTVNIIDKNANTVYYKYIDIFSDTSDFYLEYIRNHEMLYESVPQKMTYNPVKNFSFETESISDWDITAGTTYSVDDIGYVGEHALSLEDGGCVYQSISLSEGVYTFRANIKNEDGSSTGAYIEVLDEISEYAETSIEWQNLTLPIYVSHDNSTVVLKLVNNSDETVKFDNITIIENVNTSQYNIVNNGSFEEDQLGNWGWGLNDFLFSYYNRYSINDGSGDIDDTFESILGEYAYGIEGSPTSSRKTTTTIYRNYIDELGNSGKLYVGGWGNNYSSPLIGKLNIDEEKIFRINVDFYNGLTKLDVYSDHIDFDQGIESWQYVYKEIYTPDIYTKIKVSIEYQGLGEVIFDGITAFFEVTNKIYEYDEFDRLTKITYNDGRIYNLIYENDDDINPSQIKDKDNIQIMKLDSNGSSLEYIKQHNITSTPSYNTNGQITSMAITGYKSAEDIVFGFPTTYFTTSTSYMWDDQYISSTTDEFNNTTKYQTDELTGLLEHIENSKNVKTQYEYYDNGMLYHVYVGESTSGTPYVKYEYDNQFRLVKIELDTDYYYAINYDDLNRISSVQVNTNTLMSYSYKENEVNLINEYIFGNYNIYESSGGIYTNSNYSTVIYNSETIEVQANDINLDPAFGGFIKVEPNMEYTVSAEILSITGSVMFNIFEYSDEPKAATYIGVIKSSEINRIGEFTKTFTTSSLTKYVIIAFYNSSTFTIEFRDLMLDKNDEFETGILSSQTYGNGDEISFIYNNDGQVEYIRFTDSIGNETTRYHYLYDSYGRVSIYEDLINGTSERYEYDMQGRIVRVKHSNDDEIIYGYDSNNNLNSIEYDFGTITSEVLYNYESGANQGLYDNTIYDNGGNKIERNYIFDDYGLRNLEQIQVIVNENSNSYFNLEFCYSSNKVRINTITYNFTDTNHTDISYTYTYDSLGNIETETYKEDGNIIIIKKYIYNNYNQLIQESVNDTTVDCNDLDNIDVCYVNTYIYDLNGNIKTKNVFKYIDTDYSVVKNDVQSYKINQGSSYMSVLYNDNKSYNQFYSINVGDSINISYNYFASWPPLPLPGIITLKDYSNVDVNTPGYYLIECNGSNLGGNYDLDFGIVVKVGDVVVGTLVNQINFDYDGLWKDQLNSYTIIDEGILTTSNITYDDQGNPTQITNFNYMGNICDSATLKWEGRELASITVYDSSLATNPQIDYTYNDQGIRIKKVIVDVYGTTTYEYKLSGDSLVAEIVDNAFNTSTDERNLDYKILYNYDVDGSLIGFTYYTQTTTVDYLYILNKLGDITHIVDLSGNIVVEYSYDVYGNIINVDGTLKDSIGLFNSFRYRSYKYDNEISMYYLNSRYYNPEIGRFINADGLLGEIGNIQSTNMYAYCANNPVMFIDSTGMSPKTWMIIGSIALIAVGIIFIGAGGGVLVAAGAGSLLGGFTNELIGGKFEAGWLGGLISGSLLGAGSMAGAELLYLAAEAKGLAVVGLVAGSIVSSFGIAAFGGGIGSYVQQRMDFGVSGVDRNKVHNNSLMYGLLGLTASLIPQGSAIKPFGSGWASAFCVGGEIVIDVTTWFYEMVDSGEIKLPRPVFV